jgi:hypothetical protein
MLTKKLQDIVDEALNAGLKVDISRSKGVMEFVHIGIGSGYAEDFYKPNSLMQQIVQWDRIQVHASREADQVGAFKITASRLGLERETVELNPKLLNYIIQDMGEQVEKYLTNKIEIG